MNHKFVIELLTTMVERLADQIKHVEKEIEGTNKHVEGLQKKKLEWADNLVHCQKTLAVLKELCPPNV